VELASLTQLQSLDISDNINLARIPSQLALTWSSSLSNLDITSTRWSYHLDWSNESLTDTIVPSITLIAKLLNASLITSINLSGNSLVSLPSFMYTSVLPSLTHIDISGNSIAALPDIEMLRLWPSLQSFDASHNKLQFWPFAVDPSLWPNITLLDLSYNTFASIAPISVLSRLKSHTTLRLKGNDEVTALDFEAQGLYELHEGLFDLTTLVRIDAAKNYLTVVPDSINKWVALTDFYISENAGVTQLPSNVSGMISMETLQLYNLPMNDLPASMNTWHLLLSIDMRATKFTSLPPVVWYLYQNHQLNSILIDDTPIITNQTLLVDMEANGMRCKMDYSESHTVCGIDCDATINGAPIGW
jgi:hypothetical protein